MLASAEVSVREPLRNVSAFNASLLRPRCCTMPGREDEKRRSRRLLLPPLFLDSSEERSTELAEEGRTRRLESWTPPPTLPLRCRLPAKTLSVRTPLSCKSDDDRRARFDARPCVVGMVIAGFDCAGCGEGEVRWVCGGVGGRGIKAGWKRGARHGKRN